MNGESRFPLLFRGLSKSFRRESFQLDLACLTRIMVFIVTRILFLASAGNTDRGATSSGPCLILHETPEGIQADSHPRVSIETGAIQSKRRLQTWGCPPHSRPRSTPHFRFTDGHGGSRPHRHHEGDGARRYQDDDDLRVARKEPHPGAGGAAGFNCRPERRQHFADLWDERARLFA